MRITLAISAFVLLGCATIPSERALSCLPRLPKSGVRICYGSQAEIWRQCFNLPPASSPPRDWIGRPKLITQACWMESSRTIYAEDTYCGWRFAAYHERRHEDGEGHGEDDSDEVWDWGPHCPTKYE